MKVLIVFDHPYALGASENAPHKRSFTAALTAAAIRGLVRAGHEVDVIDLHADGFHPVMTAADLAAWRNKTVVDAAALDYQRRLRAADHVVFAFPIWWESMPAMTKGFIDKVMTKGIVYSETKPGRPFQNGLKNLRGVTLLTVMATPDFLYRWLFGNPITKIFFRGTFRKIGVKNLRWMNFSNPAGKTPARREDMLEETMARFAAL
ncbi:NAD(P)H-dependent oxidoreductase [Variovorax sp. ZT5P49]|uniref:NAD(P)H-dependent oxidoreductase n=1 Tax=Variovorax sp. ZT5P49 TaxID=3443733 RepID=UPI003F464910